MSGKRVIELKDVAIYHAENPFGNQSAERLVRSGELVLSEVNLSVDEGEFVYLIGRVGSGKSTLLKTLYADVQLLVGEGAVVGNSTELKNVILFDKVQVPHYNYVGDSILGYRAHMGAGSITSNVKSDKLLVKVHAEDGDIETGIKKFGAMLGDCVEVGCGSVLNPGTVIGRNCNIYPLSSVRGCVDADSIYKKQGEITRKI